MFASIAYVTSRPTSKFRQRFFANNSLTWIIAVTYLLATVQVAGCYFTLVRPYINTALYEAGKERLPFQTRVLMMPLMIWAHQSRLATASATLVSSNTFWYLRPAEPEAVVQLCVNIASLIIAGLISFKLYCGARRTNAISRRVLAPLVYPLFLLLFTSHYILHTIQNFRFLYDLPSIAFFAGGLYLIYFRKHPLLFAALFIVSTLNRETTLLLLLFFALTEATRGGTFKWSDTLSLRCLGVTIPLAICWIGWHFYIFHVFKYNVSEYYPRVLLNLYTIVHPRYWPQLLSAGGFIVPFVILFRDSIVDIQLKAWLLVLPVWCGFMFFWGILVETRVFGELLPYLACVSVLIAEEKIRTCLLAETDAPAVGLSLPSSRPEKEIAA
jgi:hypothetical protein